MRPVLWVVPLGVRLGVDGAAAVAAGAGGAQPGVAVAGGEHTPHLTICTTDFIIMDRLNLVKNINFGLDEKIFFFDILKNCILGH